LGDLIETRALSIGPGLSEAGNAGVDQPRIDRAERLVVDAQTMFDVGAEILDHHIRLPSHAAQRLDPHRALEIEGDAAFAAMQVLKVGAVTGGAGVFASG